jgi:23S rRNA (cytosine1962-C5)-methyltransferase
MAISAPVRSVVLRKDLARSIRRGHPWVYRDALNPVDAIEDGTLVGVQTRDGRTLARGFWDSRSPIAVRVLESGAPSHRYTDLNTLVEDRLQAALDRRLARLDPARTNAFRWVHGEADLLPGLHLDIYADVAAVRFDGDGARAFYEPLAQRLHDTAGSRLAVRAVLDRDDREGSLIPRAEPRGIPVNMPRGSARGTELEVLENGVRFLVDLAHGQKGGLFLDQRENRLRVAERARGKSLLNLFGYTGGFSLHAAVAGASRTDTVDIAGPAIAAARVNFERNGLPLSQAGFHTEDAFDFLSRAARQGEEWDIVVADPPSFAARRDAVPAALRSYTRLHRLAASVTRAGGLLCASSCSSHVGRDAFIETISAGVHQAGRRWTLEALHGAAFDHPSLPAFPEGDYLKFAVGRVW